jgi:hypothetical protein
MNKSIYDKIDIYFDSLRNSSKHWIDEDKLLHSNKFFTESELNTWRKLCDVAYRDPFDCNCLILESTYGKILYINPILIHALTGEKLLEEYIKGHFRITKFNLDEHN